VNVYDLLRAILTLVLTCAAGLPSARAQSIFSEVQIGVLAHDLPVLGEQREHGADINGELRFVSPVPDAWVAGVPPAFRWMLTPRPDVGMDANTSGYTGQVYLGLTWTAVLFRAAVTPQDRIDFSIGFGPAFDNGHRTESARHLGVGSGVLFHPSIELAYWIDPRLSVSLYFEHSSNAGLEKENAGLNNAGVRVGLGF
jgi:lipid A 3-O-deacylase